MRTRPYRHRLSGDATCVAIVRRDQHVVRLRTRPYRRRPSGDATGMSCACARGLIVVAIVQRDRHVVHLRTRPYHRRPSGDATGMSCACAQGLIVVARLATQPACRALAHKALSLLPVWRRNRHVVRLRTRPYCCRPSGNVTGMSCACARGLIAVAAMQRDVLSCACAQGLIVVARLATQPACRALAHEALSSSPTCDITGMSCACA